MKKFVADHIPPGIRLQNEILWILFGWGCSAVFSFLRFYTALCRNMNMLEQWDGSGMVKQKMPDLADLLFGSMAGFWVVVACMGALAAYHYYYHYNGSKSIYLMRRLKNPLELHKRCLTLPVLAAGITFAIAFLLLCAYYGCYMSAVPAEYLTPGQWEKIWR